MIWPDSPLSDRGANEVVLILFVLAVSYPVGVSLNFLARLIPWANCRSKVDLVGDANLTHIKDAHEAFFQIDASEDSWSYCYGIVAKHGYSVNMELFSRLDIFCRSMMAGSAIIFLAAIALALLRLFEGSNVQLALAVVCSAVAFLTFLVAARTYSRAFVRAIYQGFYSWYADHKLN
jgi:hypothetical protein